MKVLDDVVVRFKKETQNDHRLLTKGKSRTASIIFAVENLSGYGLFDEYEVLNFPPS